jgi:hypothetical protein
VVDSIEHRDFGEVVGADPVERGGVDAVFVGVRPNRLIPPRTFSKADLVSSPEIGLLPVSWTPG